MAKRNKQQEEELKAHQEKVRLINEASKSLQDYNNLLRETDNLNKNLEHIQGQRLKIQEKVKKLQNELNKGEVNGIALTNQEIDARRVKLVSLEQEIDALVTIEGQAEKNLKIHQDAAKSVKVSALTWKEIGKQAKDLGKTLYDQRHYWIKQQKSVRETELQMGILSNQAGGFRDNIYKSSITTAKIGIDTKELANLQGRYSDNIGRSVQLSDEQLQSMSQLAKGTVLGVEGAAEFAAQMDKFNVSAKGSVEFVEDLMKTSTDMGVSSGKVIKNVQKNIKLANKYTFKGGIKGLGEMAALATKFKFEMQDIANFAENLITPEGAVEAAAKLQVLGGAWAKMGDPFELMYRSRNDLKGLTEDIINATKETARFDEATGEVTIDPMELHRLREVANATGMSFDSLANSAREAAKFTKIESGISSIFDEEDKKYISSLAQFNEKTGEFEISLATKDGNVKESVNALKQITPEFIKSQREYQASLQERAEEAMTFNERFDALQNTFKSGLLPAFEKISGVLEGLIESFSPMVTSIAEWMADSPKTFAILGSAITGLALFSKEAAWVFRGMKLGVGFNKIANVNGGGSSPWEPGQKGQKGPKGMFGKLKAGGKMGAKMGGKMGGGAGLLTGAMAGYSEWSENSEAGMDTGENIGRTIMTGGGGIAGGALAGAAIGAFGGPLAPVTVPIGALIGSIAGAYGGDKFGDAYFGDNTPTGDRFNDFVSRPGENPISFNSSDTLIGAKPDGPIDKLLDNSGIAKPGNNTDLSDTLIGAKPDDPINKLLDNSEIAKPGNNTDSIDISSIINAIEKRRDVDKISSKEKQVNTSSNKVSVEFNKPLAIEGKLELVSGNSSTNINLNDPFLIRALSEAIQKQLTSAISGGKISSNPVVA